MATRLECPICKRKFNDLLTRNQHMINDEGLTFRYRLGKTGQGYTDWYKGKKRVAID